MLRVLAHPLPDSHSIRTGRAGCEPFMYGRIGSLINRIENDPTSLLRMSRKKSNYSLSVWKPNTSHIQVPLGDEFVSILPHGQAIVGETERIKLRQPGRLQLQLSSDGTDQIEVWNDVDNQSCAELVQVPCAFQVNDLWISIESQVSLDGLSAAALRRPRRIGRRTEEPRESDTRPRESKACAADAAQARRPEASERPPSLETLQLWFEALGALQRHPANSFELFQAISKAMVNPGGLDATAVVARGVDGTWEIRASELSPPFGLSLQTAIAEHVELTGEATIVDGFEETPNQTVLAVPYFNEQQDFAGLIYAQRDLTKKNSRQTIRSVEVQYAQSLAETLTSGYRRFAMEEDRNRIRYMYARCFSPPVIQAIENAPELLEAREETVSVMLADLRNFTNLSQHLESKRAFDLLTDAMNELTEAVMETEGVVIDYFGDGLAAMWNAPQPQANFAAAATNTAKRMHDRLSRLSDSWQDRLGQRLKMVTAIATGPVIVGNAGSDLRMKYGPRGTTVSLASRLESAAKKLDEEIIVCGATRALLGDSFSCHRLGSAHVPGIDVAYDIYQVARETGRWTSQAFDAYEEALSLFDQEQYGDAIDLLEQLAESGQGLGATETLREQAAYLREFGHRVEISPIQFVPRGKSASRT